MSERLKKILQIGGFILVVIGIGFAMWRVFFRELVSPPPAVTPPETELPPLSGLPPAGQAPPRVEVPITPESAPTAPSPIATGGLTQTAAIGNAPVLSPFLA